MGKAKKPAFLVAEGGLFNDPQAGAFLKETPCRFQRHSGFFVSTGSLSIIVIV